MPIRAIDKQRRLAPQGKIRLGHKVTGTTKQGKTYTRPAKLDRYRFTSPNEGLIKQVADLYGGTPQPWDNDGKAEYEVITDARTIPVVVVRGGFSQWHEHWTRGGGCVHRCDGEMTAEGMPCNPDDPDHQQAILKPTTRLSVMLRDVGSLGTWTLETKGWNAALELPWVTELAIKVADLVPATITLTERTAVVQTDKGPQLSRFVVPVLDLQVTRQQLFELTGTSGGGAAAIDQQERVAIEAPRPDYAALLADAATPDDCRAVWTLAGDQGDLDDALKAEITKHAQALAAAAEAAQQVADVEQAEQAPADEPVDAEVVHDEPAAEGVDPRTPVWQELLLHAGQRGMSNKDLQADVEFMRGKSLHDCTVEDLQAVLEAYRTGEVPARDVEASA